MRRDLVLARVGATSLHPTWLDRGSPRDWDLHLIPYQRMPSQDGLDLTLHDVVPGPKWSGIRDLLERWDGWRDYEMIWLPDDDLLATQSTIDAMFAAAERAGLRLFAPALHESSYFAHFSTMRNTSFFGRRTGFVEIMCPGFTTEALAELLPTLELSTTGWGWGLDSLWPKLLGYRDLGVLDGVPVLHTRPVGRMRDEELARRVRAESDAILANGDCRQVHTTFGAFGEDGEAIELSQDELLVELVRGWSHLLDRDPRLLSWITEYQRPSAGWSAYPIEGTPEAGSGQPPVAARMGGVRSPTA
jgi:hypothetical protein